MIMAVITLDKAYLDRAASKMKEYGYEVVQIRDVKDCLGAKFDNMMIDVKHPDRSDLIDHVKHRIVKEDNE